MSIRNECDYAAATLWVKVNKTHADEQNRLAEWLAVWIVPGRGEAREGPCFVLSHSRAVPNLLGGAPRESERFMIMAEEKGGQEI